MPHHLMQQAAKNIRLTVFLMPKIRWSVDIVLYHCVQVTLYVQPLTIQPISYTQKENVMVSVIYLFTIAKETSSQPLVAIGT